MRKILKYIKNLLKKKKTSSQPNETLKNQKYNLSYFTSISKKMEKENKKFSFSDYEILKLLKKTKNSKKYLTKNKITQKTTILKIYNKKNLYENSKISKLKKNLKFSKKFGISEIRIFQDKINLYIEKKNNIIGSLQDLIINKISIKEEDIKYITISILKNLAKIHKENFLYLNLHPKNIIFDNFGKLYIKKFEFLQKIKKNHFCLKKKKYFEYFPPEIFFNKKLDITSDFYSLGVILYKIVLNEKFYNKKLNLYNYQKKIKKNKLLIKKFQIPEGWSLESADFINRLLQHEKSNRLGILEIEEIFEHPWILKFWENVRKNLNGDILRLKNVLELKNGFKGRKIDGGRKGGWGEVLEDFDVDLEFLEFDFL